MRLKFHNATVLGAVLLALAACNGGSGSGSSSGANPTGGTPASNVSTLSVQAQAGQKIFFDQSLSSGKNMSCASCHSPQYAYGPANSLAVQLGSDGTSSGARAVPSIRYKNMMPAYDDNAANPDGVTGNAPGGGFMLDGRAPTLADQAALPLLNPIEMNNASKDVVVQAVENGSYVALFKQAFGANIFSTTDTAFAAIGQALQAFQMEDPSFHPYSSKVDRYVHNKLGGTPTPAEARGLAVFSNPGLGNCSACHYAGPNFGGTNNLMTDFTYQALGAPRNPDIAANAAPGYYDMGLCGPYRTDRTPALLGTPDSFCGRFKVPTLRNVSTRTVYFHNGVFHSLNQVLHFYNTRDTHPEYWYPSSGGSGTPVNNPSYTLQATYIPGATVAKFNDLPVDEQGNVDEEVPFGTGVAPATNPGATTLSDGMPPRPVGSMPAMTEQQISDLMCFLNILSDGYQPPDTPPTTGACVN